MFECISNICISLGAFAPAVGFFQMLSCLRPRTITTPSGRSERNSPALNTLTSWKRSSRHPAPKPPASQSRPSPPLAFLHLFLSLHNSYPVSGLMWNYALVFFLQHVLSLSLWWCVSLNQEDSPERPPPAGVTDNRQCVLCLKYGDENTNVSPKNKISSRVVSNGHCLLYNKCWLFQEEGRLLYIGQNEWTHVNCALWSAEVFEDDDGALKNVHMAVLRGKKIVRQSVQRTVPSTLPMLCFTDWI